MQVGELEANIEHNEFNFFLKTQLLNTFLVIIVFNFDNFKF